MPEHDLTNQIAENAAGLRRAQGDSGSAETHSLKDQIEADQYLASKAAARRGVRALRVFKMSPPGAGSIG